MTAILVSLMPLALQLITGPIGLVAMTWVLTYLVKHQVFTRLGWADQTSIGIKAVSWSFAILLTAGSMYVNHVPLTVASLVHLSGPLALTLSAALGSQKAHDVGSALAGTPTQVNQ